MNSFVHLDNNEKNNLILVKSPTHLLDDTTLTGEAQHSINFARSNKKYCLSLLYDGSNSFLFVHAIKDISNQSKIF